MTEASNRHLLDNAVADFRGERVHLIREGGEEAAAELTARAAEFLTALAGEARKAYGKDDGSAPRFLRGTLLRAPAGNALDDHEVAG
jgi:hypothetical protein